MRRSTEYKSQAVHHEAQNNHKAVPYKEQILDAYNADRRRVPTDKATDGKDLRKYWKDMIASIREPTDAKMCGSNSPPFCPMHSVGDAILTALIIAVSISSWSIVQHKPKTHLIHTR